MLYTGKERKWRAPSFCQRADAREKRVGDRPLARRSASDLAQGMYVPGGNVPDPGRSGASSGALCPFCVLGVFRLPRHEMEELKHNKKEKVSTGGRLNILYHLASRRNLYTLQAFLCSSLRRQLGWLAILSALKFS